MIVRIFKYPLEVEHRQLVMMPEDARALYVTEQNEQLVMYAEVPQPVAEIKPRVIRVVTSGDEYEGLGKRYVGSTTLGQWFVAHVFEYEEGPDPIDLRNAEDFMEIKKEQKNEKA